LKAKLKAEAEAAAKA